MNTNTSVTPSNKKSEITNVGRVRMIIRAIVYMTLLLAILFITAGRWDWTMAWIYVGLMLITSVVSRVMMLRKYPDLIEERAGALEKEDTKAWDKVLVRLTAFLGPLATLIMAGLDMRFGWSPQISLEPQLIALAILVLGYLVAYWATMSNRFFSATVRIQTERGHTVVTDGPYQYVRHPGYAGGVIAHLATPLMLGSLWAFIPAVLTVLLMIIRAALEDKTLQEELDGYKEYTQQVRYRLLPLIW
ncbi:MAG: isoprenylcysteine carboxylmethyltransferase family protein [Anaerolineae bacterium]|nr:isoprenylcysteine carboxylmethyltransferase family protein [Anaerolineae bacterium]